MAGQLVPVPGGNVPVRPARFIMPLPADIPIMPGEIKAAKPARRLPVGLILFLVVVVMAVLLRLAVSYDDYRNAKETKRMNDDNNLVLQAVTPAMLAHAPRGTRIPVTLSTGPRILQVEFSVVHYQSKTPPRTCVWLSVINPKTGARDTPEVPCIPGLAYEIKQK